MRQTVMIVTALMIALLAVSGFIVAGSVEQMRQIVELLLVEMVIGNVALTVYSHKRAVTVYHSYRIEKCVSVLFVEADGDNRTGFLCDLHKTL